MTSENKLKLYKFRPLVNCCDYDRVLSIINDGFYCCDFLDFNDSNEGVFLVNENTSNVSFQQKMIYRICSFSKKEALKSQLMWGHYANAGMGLAIEIEVPDVSVFKKVNYGCMAGHEYDSVEKILTNKSREWKHEEEMRYLSTDSGKYYKPRIGKIYFGKPYAHLINYNELKKAHRKLRSYLKYAELLKAECETNNIRQCDYVFS